jgi:hypothetical protein
LHGQIDLGAGVVTVSRVHAGEYRVWIQVAERPAGFATATVGSAGGLVRVRIDIGRFGKIAGRLDLEAAGRPERAAVFARSADGKNAPYGFEGSPVGEAGFSRVDDEGRFRIGGLMPGRYIVRFNQGGVIADAPVVVKSGSVTEVAVVPAPAAVLRFVSEGSLPSGNVWIELAQDDGPLELSQTTRIRPGTSLDRTLHTIPGRIRYRVRFFAIDPQVQRELFDPVEGERIVKPGETVTIPVAAQPR